MLLINYFNMLDYRFIAENIDSVKKNITQRYMKADADEVVKLFIKRTESSTNLQTLQQQRNSNAAAMKGKLEPSARTVLVEEGKRLKEAIALAEKELSETEAELEKEARKIPD